MGTTTSEEKSVAGGSGDAEADGSTVEGSEDHRKSTIARVLVSAFQNLVWLYKKRVILFIVYFLYYIMLLLYELWVTLAIN